MGTSTISKSTLSGGIKSKMAAIALVAGLALAGQARATVYNGNGATGFGGPVGQGNLQVTDDGVGNITFTLNTSAGHPSGLDGNNLVIYLSTGATGLVDTQSLTSTGTPPGSDNGNTAVSGYNNFNNGGQTTPSRSTIVFPTGFQATYAFSFANAYDALYQLPTDGSGNLTYITGSAPSTPVGASAPLNTLTIPLSDLGLAAGQSVSFVATDIDGGAAYRSNEAIGDANVNGTTTSLTDVGNPGYNNEIDFTDFGTYTTTATPEPASLTALAVGGLLCVRRRATR